MHSIRCYVKALLLVLGFGKIQSDGLWGGLPALMSSASSAFWASIMLMHLAPLTGNTCTPIISSQVTTSHVAHLLSAPCHLLQDQSLSVCERVCVCVCVQASHWCVLCGPIERTTYPPWQGGWALSIA